MPAKQGADGWKILFAAGEIGGARALIPVIDYCTENGNSCSVLNWGHLALENRTDWEKLTPNPDPCIAARQVFEDDDIGVLVFASSLKDPMALTLARYARRQNVPCIHVLDNWTSYRYRMQIDGLTPFSPDIYTAMDEVAVEDAIAEGIDKSTLVVTGQPALASLRRELESRPFDHRRSNLRRLGFDDRQKIILFISEPVENDQGASDSSPHFRGYTEKDVIRLFCEACHPYKDRIEIGILPHPRDEVAAIEALWQTHHNQLKGRVIQMANGREAIFGADGLAGMASILLYEGWLLGKPVISLQPGLRLEPLRMLQRRPGVEFIDSYQDFTTLLQQWLSQTLLIKDAIPQPDILFHQQAPEAIYRIINHLLTRATNR